MKKITDEQRRKLKKQSTKFAFVGGTLGGLAGRASRGKGAAFLTVAAAASGITSTVKSYQGSTSTGDFVKNEIKNLGASLAGNIVGFAGAKGAGKLARKSRAAAIKRTAKKKGKTTVAKKGQGSKAKRAKNQRQGKVTFARIGGRVVPIRKRA